MAKTLSPRDKRIVSALVSEQGMTQTEVARLFEISQSTVSLVVKEMKYENQLLKIVERVPKKI